MTTANNIIVTTYLVYVLISVSLTVWVARTLHRNGRAFLVDAFQGQDTLADSVNHLLVVGFYLVNLGWIVMTLRTSQELGTARAAVELLSDKVGTVLFVLGVMHFFNLFLFSQIRSHGKNRAPQRPPVAPDAVLKVAIPR